MSKVLSVVSSLKAKFVAILAMALLSAHSFAADTPPDYTLVTGKVDVGAVITGVMAIAGILASLYVAIMGVRKLIYFLKTS